MQENPLSPFWCALLSEANCKRRKKMTYKNILTEVRGRIGIITLNRPHALNAVSEGMLKEVSEQMSLFDEDKSIAAIIIKGSDKAFAAGIDINELQAKIAYEGADALDNTYKYFSKINSCKKPLIAAVAGYALGIGCELALCCDIILVADNARFSQPEISLGVIPGFGSTQRLSKTIGKSKTMEMILTGRALNAEEAVACGIASRIVALPDLFEECVKTAMRIAEQPAYAVLLAKDAVKQSFNNELDSGIAYENKNCKICLGSPEFKESLASFIEKRKK